jgi:hypothetical protein
LHADQHTLVFLEDPAHHFAAVGVLHTDGLDADPFFLGLGVRGNAVERFEGFYWLRTLFFDGFVKFCNVVCAKLLHIVQRFVFAENCPETYQHLPTQILIEFGIVKFVAKPEDAFLVSASVFEEPCF